MTSSGTDSKDARRLEKQYGTKARGIKHSVVLRKLRDDGLAATIDWLEAQGLTRQVGVFVR